MTLIVFIIAAVAGLLPLPADLAGGQSAAAYDAFLQRNALEDHTRTQGARCAAASVRWLTRSRVGGDDIPQEVSSASLTRDAVIEHVTVTGCGRTQRHNLLVYRQRSDNRLVAVPLPTGESLASPTLQRDSFSAAVRIAVGMSPQARCPPGNSMDQNFRFGDISLETRPSGPRRAWSERMPIMYCGLVRTVVVTYTPSPQGGTDWDIRPAWPGAPQR